VNRVTENRSPKQTLLSVVILATLLVIGGSIFLIHYRINPAVLQPGSLLPPAQNMPASLPPTSAEAIMQLPPGLVPLTPSETFESHNLSDKINGKAELYLSAGFNRLISQRLTDGHTDDIWFEVLVYDMGTGQNAFSVFSAQRREDAQPLGLTQYSYRTSNAIFLVHGPYYMEIIASNASEQIMKSMQTLAEYFIRENRTETITIAEEQLFPEKDKVANSTSLIASDAFGYDHLNQIYTAEYTMDGNRLMAYLSHRGSSEEANKLASAYRDFLVNFGGKSIDAELIITDALVVEILDTYEIIFPCGPYLAGVREAANLEQATILASQLFNKIKEVIGDF